jgi:hypothetical protein
MLEIAIGALTTLLGVALGCMVLELAMKALKYSLRSLIYDKTGEHFQTPGSLVAWEKDQAPPRIRSFFSSRSG